MNRASSFLLNFERLSPRFDFVPPWTRTSSSPTPWMRRLPDDVVSAGIGIGYRHFFDVCLYVYTHRAHTQFAPQGYEAELEDACFHLAELPFGLKDLAATWPEEDCSKLLGHFPDSRLLSSAVCVWGSAASCYAVGGPAFAAS